MIESEAAIGLFGKVPSLGDFFQRDLPSSFVRPWDDWLSRSMVSSQAALGNDWAQIFLLSPPWRFHLAPGLCGEQGWIGVLVASIDRVNRFYPITLALPLNVPDAPTFMADWRGILDRLEAAAFALIDAQAPMDEILAEARAGIEVERRSHLQRNNERLRWIENNEARVWIGFGDQQGTPMMPGRLALPGIRGEAGSVWWHDFWEPHPPTTLVCQGLPPDSSFAFLLDSQWRHPHLRALGSD